MAIAIQTRKIFVRWLIFSMFQLIASLEGKKAMPFHWLRPLLLCAKSYGKLYKYSLIAIMRLNRKQMISVVC